MRWRGKYTHTSSGRACCARPKVTRLDYRRDGESVVNRVCLTCGQHWYGPADAVREYTRAQWEAWVAEAAV